VKKWKRKSYQSWTISDEFWEAIKDEIPKKERAPEKHYVHAPGKGRKPMPARKALEGIFYVLRMGCQWKALPRAYGSGSTVHRTFQNWLAAGFFEKIWARATPRKDRPMDFAHDLLDLFSSYCTNLSCQSPDWRRSIDTI